MESWRIAAQLLPHGLNLFLGRWFGRLFWLFSSHTRRRAERQLLEAGVVPDKPAARQGARKVFESLGMVAMEWFHSNKWDRERLCRQVRMEGREVIDNLQAKGRGIIFISAHMGNWELLLRAFEAHTGKTMAVVMAERRNPELTRWLIRLREAGGSKLIPAHSANIGMVRHVRKGGFLGLIADQDSTRARGVFVDFFHKPAYTPAGPAHLAHRLGAPIVPLGIIREPHDPKRHLIHFGNPIEPDPQMNEETDILRITQTYTRVLEDWIRQHPTQWAWVHNRWNHRPGDKIRIRSAGGRKVPINSPEIKASSGK